MPLAFPLSKDETKRLIRRFENAKSARSQADSIWQEIADHVIGLREFHGGTNSQYRNRMRTIYDATGLKAALLLAGGLHMLLTSPVSQWFRLVPEPAELLDDYEVALWISEVEKRLMAAFQRQASLFTPQLAEVYLEIATFGTGALFVAERPNLGPLFQARPLQEVYIEPNEDGVIDRVWRLVCIPSEHIERMWPGMSEEAKKNVAANRGHEKLDVLQLTEPGNSNPGNPFSFPFRNVVVLLKDSMALEHGGFREMPWIVARWMKEPGEDYGRGPGWVALSDQKMLNEMSRTFITAAQKQIDPPLLVSDDGVLGVVDTQPGARISVRPQIGSEQPIRPMELPANSNFPIGDAIIRQRQQMVREAFYSPLFQLFEDPRMTATQVIELSNQIQRLMAPMMGRLHSELQEPIIDRVFAIEMRRGRIPPPPRILAGGTLRVDIQSPVARAQRAVDGRAVLDTWNAAQVIAGVRPEVLDGLDPDASLRVIHAANGSPPEILRSQDDIEDLRDAREEIAAQQAQIQQAMAMSEMAKNLGGAEAGGPASPEAAA